MIYWVDGQLCGWLPTNQGGDYLGIYLEIIKSSIVTVISVLSYVLFFSESLRKKQRIN